MKTGMILFGLWMGFVTVADGGSALGVRSAEQSVDAAIRCNQQLPLQPADALGLAEVARSIGDSEAEIALLERAVESPIVGEVARVRLAQIVVDSDADRAASLVLPSLKKAGTRPLRMAAVEVAHQSVVGGLSPELHLLVEHATRRLSGSTRRMLDAVLLDPGSQKGRAALRRLIERNQGDGAALDAARRLQVLFDLSYREQWLITRCLYRHALYREAAAALEVIAESGSKEAPSSEVAFLRGRCAFRLDRWSEADSWYRRALKSVSSKTRRAEIEVHSARARELGGDLEGAVEMARRAVISDTSDNRRLFLIRLRLRQGRPDLAVQGISALRGSSSRSRGRLLMALRDLADGRTESALTMLDRVRARPWRAPALIVAAEELVRVGRPEDALRKLNRAAKELDPFWGDQARKIMALLPETLIAEWRTQQREQIRAGGTRADQALRRWAMLEFDAGALADIRSCVVKARSIEAVDGPPEVPGLAGDLRAIGLNEAAVLWDWAAFPVKMPAEGLWTAHQFLLGNSPWLAIRTTDSVWQRWGRDLPVRAYPRAMEEALFPLPRLREVKKASEAGGIDWPLVAGVAREESRWNPEVKSQVGARGLMQLMPLTAITVAARLGKEAPTPRQLFEPRWSLELGAAELGRLTRSFSGFSAAAVAAYNAGEAQSGLWLDQCGPECSEARFVLGITFEATRHYTGDVLASEETYRRMSPGSPEPAAEEN